VAGVSPKASIGAEPARSPDATPLNDNIGVGHLQPASGYTGVVLGEPENTAVPTALVTLQDFLNTLDERSFSVRGTRHLGGDELATGAALGGWLAGRGLIPPGTQPTGADLAAAHRLRDALRGALAARASSGWDGRAGANGALAGLTLRVELGADGTPHLSPVAGTGVPAALARLAATTALAEADGSWQRLKICAAPDCRWVFYDTSRSGAGRWCSMRVCGNRDKTRAYRQRHRGNRESK
jgi:predicted RNA-binding Zn ribbon-like protein